jgi:hypothetical protein
MFYILKKLIYYRRFKMALKLLNPSLRPLGQFDLASDTTLVGGECVSLATDAADPAAADVSQVGPFVNVATTVTQLAFGLSTFQNGSLCGLADDGSAGYGTQFGTQIGQNAGKGVNVPLNMGAVTAGGAVVIGPSTDKASGKVTVWHAPGLYAVNGDALATTTTTADNITVVNKTTDIEFTAADIGLATAVNSAVFAQTATGKLYVATSTDVTTSYERGGTNAGGVKSDQIAVYAGWMKDSSLVSTPLNLAASGAIGSGSTDERAYGSAYSTEAEEYVIYFLGNQGLI